MTRRRKDPRAGLPQPRGATARTARVLMRVEPATKKRWLEAAARENQTLSKWIEEAADTAFARGGGREMKRHDVHISNAGKLKHWAFCATCKSRSKQGTAKQAEAWQADHIAANAEIDDRPRPLGSRIQGPFGR